MKNLLKLLIITLPLLSYSQDNNISVMAGIKSIELQYSYTTESELIFGLSGSITESKVVEKIINNMDEGKRHYIKQDIIPAAFILLGAKFDNLSIIGKIGGVYIDQTINNKQETRYYSPTVGIIFDYKFNNNKSIRASFDGVSGGKLGIGINF